ncbi:prosaposin isoform X1 [Alosa sapidissima]|uniref:prosaposin isoform X1 n=1 Tax=Alosa sapidissima TaxID=34773 RepID=UPI001C08E5E3|nr:prosaposin isoform X1 [Alosa sapidissima]
MLLLALFITTAVATPLLGTEQCARGPPYWCKNVKTASLCGAVTHCQQNVWNKPQMKSVPCDLCKEVLIVVEQLLKDNATESEILSYIDKACTLIPDESLAEECKELVDSYYPIIIGIIKGELEDPAVACGAMGLCNSMQAALAKAQSELLSNEIPQVDLSQRAAPFLLNIPQLLYPEAPKQEAPKKENGDVCEDCVKFLTDTQEQAKSNATFVNALIAQLESQCDLLGPGLSDMCKQYVSQYAPLVVQQLMSMEQQPHEICARAGFCESVVKSVPMETLVAAKVVKSIPALKMIPAVKMVPATKVEQPAAVKAGTKMVRARDSPQCAVCEFVMKEVEDMLQDQHTEEKVIATMEKVCSVLPKTLSAQCKDLIETYGQAIIDLLLQETDPQSVCIMLGLCKQADRLYIPVMDQTRFDNGGFCDVCKMAVRYIDGILEQNATEAEIEDAVRKVCNFMPESVRSECDQLVEQYEPLLVQLLLQMLDPDFVCMKVGACPEGLKHLLGLEQCSWGPAYWCKNMQTATRCNAVAHCKRHVWS